MNERLQVLIDGCKSNDRKAQKQLYEQYKNILFGMVRRYIKDPTKAEDVFAQGMFKILSKVNSFKDKGSFEGWMKRIIVNECLMHLRKPVNKHYTVEVEDYQLVSNESALDKLESDDILSLLDQLSPGYRTVFNLYIIEGYKHKEIAEKLGISINTSKSQLLLAKKKMRTIINNHYDEKR